MIRRESPPSSERQIPISSPPAGARHAETPTVLPRAGGAVGIPAAPRAQGREGVTVLHPRGRPVGAGCVAAGRGCGRGTSSLCRGSGGGGTAGPQTGTETSHSKSVTGKCDPAIKFTYVNTFWIVNYFQSGRLSPNLPLATAHPSPFQIASEDEDFLAAMRDRVEEQ